MFHKAKCKPCKTSHLEQFTLTAEIILHWQSWNDQIDVLLTWTGHLNCELSTRGLRSLLDGRNLNKSGMQSKRIARSSFTILLLLLLHLALQPWVSLGLLDNQSLRDLQQLCFPFLMLVSLKHKFSRGARCSQMFNTLRYKPEGRGFEIRWDDWRLSIYLTLPATLCLGLTQSLSEIVPEKKIKIFRGS
jgi:hypothetical protein